MKKECTSHAVVDPLEEMATRPVALVQDASLYRYGWDFNKNITEVFDKDGRLWRFTITCPMDRWLLRVALSSGWGVWS